MSPVLCSLVLPCSLPFAILRSSQKVALPASATGSGRACFPQRPPIPFGRRFKPKQIVHSFSRFKAIHSRPSVRVTVVHSSQKLLPTTFLDCMTTCFVKPSRGQSSRMYNCYLADQKSGLFGFKQRVQERRGGLGRGNCGLRNLSCCLSPRYWRSPERKGQPLGEWRNINSKPKLQKTFLSNFSCDKLKFEAEASDSNIMHSERAHGSLICDLQIQ